MRFSINGLGNLLYRIWLKMAAAILHFSDYSLFAGCFGPRWNFYLRDIIASIPIPLVFGKGNFESGVTARLLAEYAEDPLSYLDSELKKKMTAAYRMMWLKFKELAFDAPATAHWREARPQQADN
jgi:hypothetical protein